MSKRGYILRYSLILRKLKLKTYTSFEEIERFVNREMEFIMDRDDRLNLGFSKRTFQRDIKEISNAFEIDIEYSKTYKGYFISQSKTSNPNFERMMEAFDLFNSLNLSHDVSPFIYLEKRRPQGTENLHGLIHAIKNRLLVKFTYEKFWDESFDERLVQPIALKEFKNRWYLLALDGKENHLKSFALDRLTNLEITRESFLLPKAIDIEEEYRYCFGIICPRNQEPHDIILSFDPFQGKYIKSLPLHESQVILTDTEDELKIKLRLCITHDLVMELLSLADNMKVIEPKELVEQIKEAHKNAYKQY